MADGGRRTARAPPDARSILRLYSRCTLETTYIITICLYVQIMTFACRLRPNRCMHCAALSRSHWLVPDLLSLTHRFQVLYPSSRAIPRQRNQLHGSILRIDNDNLLGT